MIFIPNQTGYELFTSTIHQDPVTGLIHGLAMPFACQGFFLIVYGLLTAMGFRSLEYTHNLLWFIVGGMLSGYITFDPIWGVVSLVLYSTYISLSIERYNRIRYPIFVGIVTMAAALFCMEIIGHQYIESQASDITQLPNSIYHTVLYSTKSLFI